MRTRFRNQRAETPVPGESEALGQLRAGECASPLDATTRASHHSPECVTFRRHRHLPLHRRGGLDKLLHELGAEAYAEALLKHRRVVREAFSAHCGVEVDAQGDAFFVAFPTAPGALAAAAAALEGLSTSPIRVRMGVHTPLPPGRRRAQHGRGDAHPRVHVPQPWRPRARPHTARIEPLSGASTRLQGDGGGDAGFAGDDRFRAGPSRGGAHAWEAEPSRLLRPRLSSVNRTESLSRRRYLRRARRESGYGLPASLLLRGSAVQRRCTAV